MRIWVLMLTMLSVSGCVHPANGPVTLMTLETGQRAGFLTWAPDGRHLLVVVDDPPYTKSFAKATVALIDIQPGEARVLCRRTPFVSPQFTPDGQRLLLMSPEVDGQLVLRSVSSGQEQPVYRPADGMRVLGASLSPDGGQVLVSEYEVNAPIGHPHTRLRMIDLVTGKVSPLAEWEDIPGQFQWAPDARHIVWTQYTLKGKLVRLGDWKTGKVSTLRSGDLLFTRQCWSPDSRQIVGFVPCPQRSFQVLTLGVPDGATRVFGTFDNLDEPCTPYSPTANELAFSTWKSVNGRRTSTICVADAATSELKRQFGPFDGPITSIAWSPGGDMLAFVRPGAVEVLRVAD